jgi:PAS domain S-box-containing protein
MISPLLRSYLAVSSVALAMVITLLVPPFREDFSFLLLLTSVLAATWYGGRWPGVLAATLAGISSAWLLLPRSEPSSLGTVEWVQVAVFSFVALATSSLAAQRDRATFALRRSSAVLERRVEQRTDELVQATEALQAGAAVRQRAEEALSQFAAIEASTEDAVLTTTLDGTIVSCNPAAEKLYGYASTDFVGQSISLLFPREMPLDLRVFELVSLGRSIAPFESTHLRPEGSRLQILVTISPIKDSAGSVRGLCMLVRNITQRKRAEEVIQHYQQQLRRLASALSFAEQRERRRIATEMHDHLAQMLVLSRMKIHALQSGSTRMGDINQMDEIGLLLDQSIQYTRTLIWELYPPVLHEIGLEAALEWLAEEFQERHGIRVRFEDDEQPKPNDEDVRILLFQAVRELLMNVIKHAHASQAIVAVRRCDEQLEIRVEDDGVGFDMEHVRVRVGPEGGFGLFSIQERLDVIGGSFKLRSSPGAGSQVTLRAPL